MAGGEAAEDPEIGDGREGGLREAGRGDGVSGAAMIGGDEGAARRDAAMVGGDDRR
jgi:hypothetical protein